MMLILFANTNNYFFAISDCQSITVDTLDIRTNMKFTCAIFMIDLKVILLVFLHPYLL